MPARQNSTQEDLEALAAAVLDETPCAIEMPAGTGKTHLLAKAVAMAATDAKRSLILTHTNAGVEVLKKRLSKMKVPSSLYKVDTITGFAFSLARSYGTIGEVTVPEIPDWTQSNDYIYGATRVADSVAVKEVLRCSYDYFFIDEYQDCSTQHHQLILTIAQSIPKAIVLGDRLQGIFGFRGQALVDWEDVLTSFPLLAVEHTPHRWKDSNPEMGQWLQDIRPLIYNSSVIDLSAVCIPGFEWVQITPDALGDRAFSFQNSDETVLLLDKWDADVARHASRLGGSYLVMEDVRGRFMAEELERLPLADSYELAIWLAQFAKKCMTGLAGIDATIQTRLSSNQSVLHYHRDGIQDLLTLLDELRQNPSYEMLLDTSEKFLRHTATRLYRWEGWRDTMSSIRASLDTGNSPTNELAAIRDKLRHSGRRQHARVASRTVLVKGLEYDHVIIADASKMRDPKNFYVALTRAKKSITIISSSPIITLVEDTY